MFSFSSHFYGFFSTAIALLHFFLLHLFLIPFLRFLKDLFALVCSQTSLTCVNAAKARKLLDQMVETGGVTDVITYNTLAKAG